MTLLQPARSSQREGAWRAGWAAEMALESHHLNVSHRHRHLRVGQRWRPHSGSVRRMRLPIKARPTCQDAHSKEASYFTSIQAWGVWDEHPRQGERTWSRLGPQHRSWSCPSLLAHDAHHPHVCHFGLLVGQIQPRVSRVVRLSMPIAQEAAIKFRTVNLLETDR